MFGKTAISSLFRFAAAFESNPTGCGEVNVILTGLPAHHTLVHSQGWNTTMVDESLRADHARIMAAGYNVKFFLYGPEISTEQLHDTMQGINWHATGVGYGVRGASLPELTIHLEDMIQTFKDESPDSKIFFNYNPKTTLWAIKRNLPLSEDCTNSPGKDLGYIEVCNGCEHEPILQTQQ